MIDHFDLARRQEVNDGLTEWRANNPDIQKVRFPDLNVELYCHKQGCRTRICVPEFYQKMVFDAIHNLAHPGVKATKSQIMQHYAWPGMKRKIAEWTRACESCQRNKVTRYTKSQPEKIAIPDERFEHVHIDLVGPLPLANGMRHDRPI